MSTAQTTPNLGLTQPTLGAQDWGMVINQNSRIIDTAIGNLQSGFQGPWSSTQIYTKGQTVSLGGSTYISLLNANQGQSPDVSPTYWALQAAAGTPGGGSTSASINLTFTAAGTQTVTHGLNIDLAVGELPAAVANITSGTGRFMVTPIDPNTITVTTEGALTMAPLMIVKTSAGAAAVVVDPLGRGLLAHWPMKEGSGTTLTDTVSGANMTGILGTNWVGNKLHFSGASQASGAGAPSPSAAVLTALNGQNPFTVSFKVNLDSLTPGALLNDGQYTFFATTNISGGTPGVEVLFNQQGQLEIALIANLGANNLIDATSPSGLLTASADHIIAVTYDGSGHAAGLKLYLDETAVALTAVVDTLSGPIVVSTGIYAMCSPYGGVVNNTVPGFMGGLRINGVVLNSSEIAALQNGAN